MGRQEGGSGGERRGPLPRGLTCQAKGLEPPQGGFTPVTGCVVHIPGAQTLWGTVLGGQTEGPQGRASGETQRAAAGEGRDAPDGSPGRAEGSEPVSAPETPPHHPLRGLRQGPRALRLKGAS